MTRASDLTSLVGSRICHDLVSPLGAIGNGIELMGLSGISNSPEFALIEESIKSANARICFFRIAYGAAKPDQFLSRSEISSTLASVARGGRLSYFWNIAGDQPKTQVRSAFLLLQCLETAMPYGGDIHINQFGETWELRAEADRMTIDQDLWDRLGRPRTRLKVSPGQVQFALLPEVLAEGGRSLALKLSDTQIIARF